MEHTNTFLDYITAIGSLATPVIVLILTAIGWKYRQIIDRKLKLEEQLREDRIETYNQILEPYIILLTPDSVWELDTKNKKINKSDFAISKILSLEYRKLAFKLSLVASDEVYQSYSNLMQHSYLSPSNPDETERWNNTLEMMNLLGQFLLSIRKSMGNESTKVDNWEMLDWFITDSKKMKREYQSSKFYTIQSD